MDPTYLVWTQNGVLLRGYQNGAWVDGNLAFPVGFPGQQNTTQTVVLSSSAGSEGTLETLNNVRLYLTGDLGDLAIVQGLWPALGDAYSPPRPEMNGGFDISFDGSNYIRFSTLVGLASDPTTWLTVPAVAIGQNGADGVLGPYSTATMFLRYVIPPTVTTYKTFNIQLAVDMDIV